MVRPWLCGSVWVVLASTWPAAAVTLSQVDNFENGTTMGWKEGVSSPNPPSNVASGGPAGPNDNYLRDVSTGTSSAGGKMIMFNNSQWTGNYITAGVTQIEADLINLGNTQLNMRIAFESGFTHFVSSPAVVLPAGSGWKHVIFKLDATSMVKVDGPATLATALGSVSEMRILSNTAASFNGAAIAGTLGVDNIKAVPEPASLVSLTLGGLLAARRRRG